jgi:hypothetical protein
MATNPTVRVITVKDTPVSVLGTDYISLTDIAKSQDSARPDDLIRNWIRNRNTIEFLGIWEQMQNPEFKAVEFEGFRNKAGLNSFSLSPKQWIEQTGAIGIVSRAGRNGGTFAHPDIAFEFASWLSVEFRLYLLKEFQRLKEHESETESLDWELTRAFAKINYRLHSEAVRRHLIPATVTGSQASDTYSAEADVLNVALFGKTAQEWRDENPGVKGNMRDQASLAQLLVLANLETINAEYIQLGLPQPDRLARLNTLAKRQMNALVSNPSRLPPVAAPARKAS